MKEIKTSIYFPPDLYDKLLEESHKERRSFTRHIVYLVELAKQQVENGKEEKR